MMQEAMILESRQKANAYLQAHGFLKLLKKYNSKLTRQQFKTLRGQALAGDIDGAVKGLETILYREG